MRIGSLAVGSVAAALTVFVALEAQQAEPRRIATAPAFNARQLTAHRTANWITNGGNVQSLQESGFVPRNGSTAESDGYIMGVASNYADELQAAVQPRDSQLTFA